MEEQTFTFHRLLHIQATKCDIIYICFYVTNFFICVSVRTVVIEITMAVIVTYGYRDKSISRISLMISSHSADRVMQTPYRAEHYLLYIIAYLSGCQRISVILPQRFKPLRVSCNFCILYEVICYHELICSRSTCYRTAQGDNSDSREVAFFSVRYCVVLSTQCRHTIVEYIVVPIFTRVR